MDFNNYWLLVREDEENLRYVLNNFETVKFYVGLVGGASFRRETLIEENLEGKVLDFKRKDKGYLFQVNGEKLFDFEGIRQKSFDIRYRPNNISLMVTVDYEKKEYLEIHFKGKIEVEPSEEERAPGIPFYRIKKS